MGICDIDKLAKLRMRELKEKERQQREAEIKRLKMENANLRAKIESLYFATKEEEVK